MSRPRFPWSDLIRADLVFPGVCWCAAVRLEELPSLFRKDGLTDVDEARSRTHVMYF